MHMSDALLSPAVGAAMWLASAAALAWSARGLQHAPDEGRVPLMGLMGAFVFAAQMINFSIPATGSSGHLGGGLLLALLVGPHAALIVIASVLSVQALCFADGGLLALGANIFNIGVLPCLLAYPLVYRPLAGTTPSPRRMAMATMLAAVLGLQFGAAGVVAETVLSGVSSLPAQTFVWLMLPIHLAIGGVEGVATVALLRFLQRERPDMLRRDATVARGPRRRLLGGLAVAALIIGGMGSWFASTQPDGLEWSVARAIGRAESPAPLGAVHTGAATLQQRTAWLPGYTWHTPATGSNAEPAAWPQVDAGTSLAGVLGGVATLALVAAVALLLRRRAAAQPTDVRQG